MYGCILSSRFPELYIIYFWNGTYPFLAMVVVDQPVEFHSYLQLWRVTWFPGELLPEAAGKVSSLLKGGVCFQAWSGGRSRCVVHVPSLTQFAAFYTEVVVPLCHCWRTVRSVTQCQLWQLTGYVWSISALWQKCSRAAMMFCWHFSWRLSHICQSRLLNRDLCGSSWNAIIRYQGSCILVIFLISWSLQTWPSYGASAKLGDPPCFQSSLHDVQMSVLDKTR